MSTKRKQTTQTLPPLPPTPRWKPSTPHAIRALQQKSVSRRRSNNRPDSARNILRQLSRITAPQTARRISTPQQAKTPSASFGKENINAYSPYYVSIDDDADAAEIERPDFTLPIHEMENEDEDDVGSPPRRRSEGLEDTWRYRDFAPGGLPPASARSNHSRRSRMSIKPSFAEDGQDVGDETVQSVEFGRRAVSEGPVWERYPRSSFGSIRMSEFGMEESRYGKGFDADATVPLNRSANLGADLDASGFDNGIGFDDDGETENIHAFRRALSEPVDTSFSSLDQAVGREDDSFRLDLRQDESTTFPSPDRHQEPTIDSQTEGHQLDAESPTALIHDSHSPDTPQRRASTHLEEAATKIATRRPKRLKLTKDGNPLPSLPSNLIKKIAVDSMTRLGKKAPTIDRDSLAALEQATEWFFEQAGEDLAAYSTHAKRRKRIDESDVWALMKRQKVLGKDQSLMEVAEDVLPEKDWEDFEGPEDVG